MKVNYSKIRQAMWDKHLSLSKLANKMNISTASLSRKLSGKTEFTVSEAECLCSVLELSPLNVFFAHHVPNTQRQ